VGNAVFQHPLSWLNDPELTVRFISV